jgi:hypothetical protein
MNTDDPPEWFSLMTRAEPRVAIHFDVDTIDARLRAFGVVGQSWSRLRQKILGTRSARPREDSFWHAVRDRTFRDRTFASEQD